MVYAREEFADVALQDPALARVVSADLQIKISEAVDCPVCPLPYPAGIRIRYESLIKKGIEGMMQKPVSDARFMDVPRLWIGDFECAIAAMAVRTIDKVVFEYYNVLH